MKAEDRLRFRLSCLFYAARPFSGAVSLWRRQEHPETGYCPSQDHCSAVEGVTTMEVKFSRYDTTDYFKTEDDITAYLDAVMEDGDPEPTVL